MFHYIKIGKIINPENDLKNYRRLFAFVLRANLHPKCVNRIIAFFNSSTFRKRIVATHPYIIAQVVRPNFFRNSTALEKSNIIEKHFLFLEKHFTGDTIGKVYCGDGIQLWNDSFENKELSIKCFFHCHDKKEGLMRLELMFAGQGIYHVAFWISPNSARENSLYIGALQAVLNASDDIKALTKYFFGYRPKNFIIHVLRTFAHQLAIERIYAVSNYGFYDSTLPIHKRKVKTSLDQFWQETGGSICSDQRFYELPIEEPRKTIEEVVSHKRNLYRKRYAAIDAIDEIFSENLKQFLIKNSVSL